MGTLKVNDPSSPAGWDPGNGTTPSENPYSDVALAGMTAAGKSMLGTDDPEIIRRYHAAIFIPKRMRPGGEPVAFLTEADTERLVEMIDQSKAKRSSDLGKLRVKLDKALQEFRRKVGGA